jgi:hypothetical protein
MGMKKRIVIIGILIFLVAGGLYFLYGYFQNLPAISNYSEFNSSMLEIFNCDVSVRGDSEVFVLLDVKIVIPYKYIISNVEPRRSFNESPYEIILKDADYTVYALGSYVFGSSFSENYYQKEYGDNYYWHSDYITPSANAWFIDGAYISRYNSETQKTTWATHIKPELINAIQNKVTVDWFANLHLVLEFPDGTLFSTNLENVRCNVTYGLP